MNNEKRKIGILILSCDSEKYIKQTLDSVKKFASQIIVIDSGSVDSTLKICMKSGAEIYFRKWTNNFAEQRNFALKHFRTDWILAIDSDEKIEEFDYQKFQEITENPNIGGINFKIINLLDNGNTKTTHRYTRLFKNNSNIFYEGAVHEQIKESILQIGFDIFESEFSILHFGYLEKNETKIKRNVELLEEENKNKDDDWLKYHLANSYFSAENLEEAEKIFIEILNSANLTDLQKDTCKIRLAQIALRDDLFEKVLEFTNFISNDVHLNGLRLFISGTAFLALGKYKEAFKDYKHEEVRLSEMVDKSNLEKVLNALNKIILH